MESDSTTVVRSIQAARKPDRGSGDSNRVPPHNVDAERSLIGSMLLSRDAIHDAIEAQVQATNFYKPAR